MSHLRKSPLYRRQGWPSRGAQPPKPPTGAPPQHGVSALSSHASSSRSPTRPPEARGCSRSAQAEKTNTILGVAGEKKLRFTLRKTLLSPSRHSSPLAWRASPPALGIAYCTRLPWAPPARWGFPALSGSLALNLGSLPNAGRMSDEVSALVCPSLVMASPGLATMNESSHSQGTPAYLGSLIPPLPPPLSLSEKARALRA